MAQNSDAGILNFNIFSTFVTNLALVQNLVRLDAAFCGIDWSGLLAART